MIYGRGLLKSKEAVEQAVELAALGGWSGATTIDLWNCWATSRQPSPNASRRHPRYSIPAGELPCFGSEITI